MTRQGQFETWVTIVVAFALSCAKTANATEVRDKLLAEIRAGSGRVLQQDPTCLDGIVYDDGSFETGYGYGPSVESAEFVMRFQAGGAATLDSVCVCFTRDGNEPDLGFSVIVYDDDGTDGAPGNVSLGNSGALIAEDVPLFPDVGIYRVPALNLPSDGSVYVGALWLPEEDDGFFICADESGAPIQPAYTAVNVGAWDNLEDLADFATYSALGVRAEFLSPSNPCSADAKTLCLNNDRFRITATWRTPQGDSGTGAAVELTDDTGYFWFFDQDNVEMVVKVLDACDFSNRFWVFAGGLTNVEVELIVEDTQTGATNTYSNPQNTPFNPIQDTDAFATCP